MNSHNKQFIFSALIQLAIAASLIGFICLVGPMIAIGHSYPFASQWTRFITAVLICAGTAGLLMHQYSRLNFSEQQSEDQESPMSEMEKVRRHFLGALEFLKKTQINFLNKKQRLYDMPWILLIGGPQSGKTSLLAHSGLSFLLSKKANKAPRPISSTKHCDWWATREAVLLDTAGTYTIHDQQNEEQQRCWLDFLSLLKNNRTPAINGLVVNISLEKLATQTKAEQTIHFQSIRERLGELQQHLSTAVPVYIVFTKCDALAGFTEFFKHLNSKEREQLWGFSFTKGQITNAQRIADAYDGEFDKLLKRLHARLIPRLHQEVSKEKRAVINNFPLQMESIKQPIASLLKYIAETTCNTQLTTLRGIYFTSNTTKGKTFDRLEGSLSKAFAIETYTGRQPYQSKRSHFVKQLFTEVIFPDCQPTDTVNTPEKNKTKKHMAQMAIAAAVIISVGSAVLWTKNFSTDVMQISDAEQAINRYQALTQSEQQLVDANTALSALNTLEHAQDILQHADLPEAANIGLHHANDLAEKARYTYQEAVQHIARAELEHAITKQIAQENAVQPEILYGTLKAYLMLGQPQHENKQYVDYWFKHYWQQALPHNTHKQRQLLTHLNHLLYSHIKPMQLDPQLITQARQHLAKLSHAELTLAILDNDYNPNNETLKINIPNAKNFAPIFAGQQEIITIPVIYTAKNFQAMYDKLIPAAAEHVTKGNWVLGTTAHSKANPQKLIDDIRTDYMNAYIKNWQHVIAQLQLKPIQTLQDDINVIDSLSKQNTPLTALLKTIHDNTDVHYDNMPTPISIKFADYNHFIAAYQQHKLPVLKKAVSTVAETLVKIQQTNDPNQSSFIVARQRMQLGKHHDAFDALAELGAKAPAPFNNWLTTVSQDSWHILLNNTAHYLNDTWKETVVPEYNTTIAHHYPFDKKASTNVAMKNFSAFFGPKGILNAFFIDNLHAFVNTKHSKWTWKIRNHESLDFSDAVLRQYQTAAIIQSMFYPSNTDKIEVKFLLKPLQLNKNTETFAIALDDQSAAYTKETLTPTPFNWPGRTKHPAMTLSFSGDKTDPASKTDTGIWAFFHAIDKAPVINEKRPNQFKVTFDLQGYSALCEIISDSAINPFTSGIIQSYACPENLFG